MTVILQSLKQFSCVQKKEKKRAGSFNNVINKMYLQIIYIYNEDLILNR